MARSYLLPLYIIRKPSKLKFLEFNEKTVIVLLLIITVISILVVFKNLPSGFDDNARIKNIFLPEISQHNVHDPNDVFHVHKKIQIPNIPLNEDIDNSENHNRNNKGDDNHANSDNKQILPPVHDELSNSRREKVRNMTKLAWDSYKKYAWGANELKPLSRSMHGTGIFGSANNLGASIVDAMDTLYIMNLRDEFNDGKEWILKNFNIKVNTEMSAFEVNIRFVGGLLTIYTFTQEKEFLDKAEEVAQSMFPIFQTETGIPYSLFNPISKSVKNYNWASGSCSILAELGTLSLEFQYLTDLTGNPVYQEKIDKIYKVLREAKKDDNLFYNYINPHNGNWCGNQATIGGLADSFYEYLLKLWLYKNKSDDDLLNLYLQAMKGIREKLIAKSPGGLTFVGEYTSGTLHNKMGHLACFSGGLFALTSMYVDKLDKDQKEYYKNLAEEITHTCHESYVRSATHLGPEAFDLSGANEATASINNQKYYILRPEVVESYFYLWRMTKDNKYREWAWDAVEAIEKYCKTENGYSGIHNVYENNPTKDDVQQSFFSSRNSKIFIFNIFRRRPITFRQIRI